MNFVNKWNLIWISRHRTWRSLCQCTNPSRLPIGILILYSVYVSRSSLASLTLSRPPSTHFVPWKVISFYTTWKWQKSMTAFVRYGIDTGIACAVRTYLKKKLRLTCRRHVRQLRNRHQNILFAVIYHNWHTVGFIYLIIAFSSEFNTHTHKHNAFTKSPIF